MLFRFSISSVPFCKNFRFAIRLLCLFSPRFTRPFQNPSPRLCAFLPRRSICEGGCVKNPCLSVSIRLPRRSFSAKAGGKTLIFHRSFPPPPQTVSPWPNRCPSTPRPPVSVAAPGPAAPPSRAGPPCSPRTAAPAHSPGPTPPPR